MSEQTNDPQVDPPAIKALREVYEVLRKYGEDIQNDQTVAAVFLKAVGAYMIGLSGIEGVNSREAFDSAIETFRVIRNEMTIGQDGQVTGQDLISELKDMLGAIGIGVDVIPLPKDQKHN